jgi:hypothetical protein
LVVGRDGCGWMIADVLQRQCRSVGKSGGESTTNKTANSAAVHRSRIGETRDACDGETSSDMIKKARSVVVWSDGAPGAQGKLQLRYDTARTSGVRYRRCVYAIVKCTPEELRSSTDPYVTGDSWSQALAHAKHGVRRWSEP